MTRRPVLPARYAPWSVLAASLLLTMAAALFVVLGTRARDVARFQNAVQAAHDRVTGRLDVYISTLRGGAALFAANADLGAEEFRRYVDRLEIQQRYPGVQGIGYTRRVAVDTAGAVDERHAIVYLEPLDQRNRAAIGFDMYSEPTRREAMRRARDLGEPAMSGPVTLVQEIFEHDEQRGFLIYLPTYRGGAVPESVEERRALLDGFIYAPFRADDLFAGIFGSEEMPRVSLAVFDTHDEAAPALLHRSPLVPGYEPRFRTRVPAQIAGRVWTVEYVSQPSFEAGSGLALVPAVLFAGLLFTLWLFWLALRLTRERAAAEEANRAKSAFLANMSHELRTPLNAISGYVDLMQLGIPDPVSPGQLEYLGRVKRAQHHLLGLINDVLNFAKLEAGRVEYQRERLPITPLVAEAAEMILPAAVARDLVCRMQAGPDVTVEGDGEKIRQVLLNLLSNAIKFTRPGGSVTVTWELDGSAVRVHVIDTGIGIAAEDCERIFDPFVQVDAHLTRAHEGTGLGLSIARALARGMNGDITVTSEPGRGSTFTFTIPAPPAGGAARARAG